MESVGRGSVSIVVFCQGAKRGADEEPLYMKEASMEGGGGEGKGFFQPSMFAPHIPSSSMSTDLLE